MKDERNTGLFGLPIRPVKTKEELENLLNPKREQERKPKIDGFTYIPELNLYVADEISMLGDDWYACKAQLNANGSRMLTPAEFWIYYDYCVKNQPRIVENSFKDMNKEEWLDAVVENERELIVSPDISSDMKEYSFGTRYDDVIISKRGYFDREEISAPLGLPYVIKEKGTFGYLGINFNDLPKGVCRSTHGGYYIKAGPTIYLQYPHLRLRHYSIGVRECKEKN